MDNFPLLIQIRWHAAVETILLESESALKSGNLLATTEIWSDDGSRVEYLTHVLSHTQEGSAHELKIQYLPADNPELYELIDTWGVSTVTFDMGNPKSRPKAFWRNEPRNRSYDGLATNVRLIRASEDEFLGYATVSRRIRKQALLKRDLLSFEPFCALSGETEPGVLDAAHITEVKNNGSFGADNGFLLRTDLHRLFDKGLLIIDSETGKASLSAKVSRLSGYFLPADEWSLKPNTLARVKKNLLKRNKRAI